MEVNYRKKRKEKKRKKRKKEKLNFAEKKLFSSFESFGLCFK